MFSTRAGLKEELLKIPPVVKQVSFPIDWKKKFKHCFGNNTNNEVYLDVTNI